MPWYWILLIVSVIVGPFDALYLYNKAWKRRQKRKAMEDPPPPPQEDKAETLPPEKTQAGEDTAHR